MQLENMNWMDVEKYLEKDDRIVIVLGATEQHGYLSVCADTLAPWEIARRACEKEGVALAPPVYFGFSHWALDYPGTISLSTTTYMLLVRDLVASAIRSGFRSFLFINGHSGNCIAREAAIEAIVDQPDVRVWFYNWWDLPETAAFLQANGGMDHANWSENFSFTRVTEVPEKILNNGKRHYRQSASRWREAYPDGVMGGEYQKSEDISRQLVETATREVESVLREMRRA